MSDNGSRKKFANGSHALPPKGRKDGVPVVSVPIKSDRDIIIARQRGKELAASIGFSGTDLTLIATAISELSRNIVVYAKLGEITIQPIWLDDRIGIKVTARDDGPGIPDVPLALRDGFSTSRSLGLGLPGVRRLMDTFEVISAVNRGTTVTVKKWANLRGD